MALDLHRLQQGEGAATAVLPPAPTRLAAWSGLRRLVTRGGGVRERLVFTERLALLLKTGLSLVEALEAMQEQAQDDSELAMLSALKTSIAEGQRFSSALAEHPRMFPATYVGLVAAAEEGGFLPQVLDQLHALDERTSQLRASIVQALSYPAFLIAFSVAVVAFVLLAIFPKFEDLFASIHDDLPLSTRALMAVSSFLRADWPYALGALALAGWAAGAWLRSEAGRQRLDAWKLRVPGVSDLYVMYYLSQALGVLGLSLSNGVPITAALDAARHVVRNRVFGAFLADVQRRVTEGSGFAAGFAQARFMPPMVRQMVATGERTGALGMVLVRVAAYYEREVSRRIQLISKAVEPMMLVVMGAVVGLIVSSLILPIFKLSRAIH